MADVTFEQVKSLVEQMPSAEVNRLRDWLNTSTPTSDSELHTGTWGERLVALVNQFELDEEDLAERSDPETWVRDYRRTKTQQRNPGWGHE